jgi:hypothetical protein
MRRQRGSGGRVNAVARSVDSGDWYGFSSIPSSYPTAYESAPPGYGGAGGQSEGNGITTHLLPVARDSRDSVAGAANCETCEPDQGDRWSHPAE